MDVLLYFSGKARREYSGTDITRPVYREMVERFI